MAPFGNASLASSTDFDFFASLPPLEPSKRSPECSYLPEPVETYCLAIVDESGEVVRPASDQDLLLLLEPPTEKPKEESGQCSDQEFRVLLSQGPKCKHCGVTESPQWRRGPPSKPILCNACGTRYRRTGQLNHAAQNANRKRASPSDCAREMVGEKARAMKQPRVVA